MSFHPSNLPLSQPIQSENPFQPNPIQAKSLKVQFHSQTESVRVFGKEITNLGRINSHDILSKDAKFQGTNKFYQSSKLIVQQESYETFDQNHRNDNLTYNKTLNENTDKPIGSLPCSQLEDASHISNYSVDTNMEVEAALKEVAMSAAQNQKEEEEIMELCDLRVKDNPQFISEYATTIFKYLRENENNVPTSEPLRKQPDINEKMRAILIDWLVDVHLRFKLLDETLYLTLNLIDRYLEKRQVSRQKLQLVGVSAMLIACKYEEIYSPEIRDFVFVTDKAYSREEVLETEGNILSALGFNLTFTSALRFLDRYCQVHDAEKRTQMLARYLVELSLVEYRTLRYTPSNIAASALYLASKILKTPSWNDHLQEVTQYTEIQLRPCAKDLCLLLQNVSKSSLQAVRKKFAQPKYMEVSKIQLDR